MERKRLTATIIRFATGGLFIFSGLIKLNDPIGTQIKLEEYFEVFATDFAGFFRLFIPAALELGMILIVLEVVLGVALILNYRMRITSIILLSLILFFTFLTFYSAYFDKVTDCGCFGDAIKLTPWESFYKDIILTIFSIYIFWNRKDFEPVLSAKIGSWTIGLTTLISFLVGNYAIMHLPYIDFRAYKIGDSIPANMQPEEQPIFEYTFVKNGQEVKSQQYLMEKDGYELQGYEIINADKTTPRITDYNVFSPELGDVTQDSFQGNKLFIIMVEVDKSDRDQIGKIRKLVDEGGQYYESWILTSSDPGRVEPFRHEHQLAAPYFLSDATVLKAMIRANPGIMVVKNGVVKGKWHFNDIPSRTEVLTALVD